MKAKDIDVDVVREALIYDEVSGKIFWRRTRGPGAKKGKEAGYSNADGYRRVGLNGRQYLVHRLAWIIAHGAVPPGCQIDHIDLNKSNNALRNLRLATPTQNTVNSPFRKTNKSGFKGVHPYRRKWVACISVGGRTRHLGVFDSPESAHASYVAAAAKLYGEFANDGVS